VDRWSGGFVGLLVILSALLPIGLFRCDVAQPRGKMTPWLQQLSITRKTSD